MWWRCTLCGLMGSILWPSAESVAQSVPVFSLPPGVQSKLAQEIEMQTLGGRQFWGDVRFFRDYRIQRNVFTGHHRLLDGRDWRHHWGSYDDCCEKLDELCEQKRLAPMSGKAVICLHGILRSSKSMQAMTNALREDGYTVFPFDYPSTQVSIPDAAEYLHQVIDHLDGIDEIALVGHSMGGLVIRAYFAEHHDPRIKRAVMLGTPNYGAELADRLQSMLITKVVAGPAGRQLRTSDLAPALPAPPVEFAVIAGARGNDSGWNPLIPGDDDGTVTVASTRLAGAADFTTVPVLHHALTSSPEALQAVRGFLATGKLRVDRERQPIAESE